MMFYGIDIGTTSVGAVAIDEAERLVVSATCPHAADVAGLGAGVDEQDPAKLLSAVRSALAEVGAAPGVSIGWTGQMHGVVGVDAELNAVTRFVTWRDARRYAGRVMSGWAREGRKIFKCLSAPGYAIARLAGRCAIDETFLHSWHVEGETFPPDWLPELRPGSMLGDNQAGVYTVQCLAPGAAVVNIGTSGQLSVVGEGAGGERRPYPGGVLRCRASHAGGQALAALRERLGLSWDELNRHADEPAIAACVDSIVDDLVGDIDLSGCTGLVGIGNALRLNPALRLGVERRFGRPCTFLDVPEMAAYGAALHAKRMDSKQIRNKGNQK